MPLAVSNSTLQSARVPGLNSAGLIPVNAQITAEGICKAIRPPVVCESYRSRRATNLNSDGYVCSQENFGPDCEMAPVEYEVRSWVKLS